jgi:hypothetical protein
LPGGHVGKRRVLAVRVPPSPAVAEHDLGLVQVQQHAVRGLPRPGPTTERLTARHYPAAGSQQLDGLGTRQNQIEVLAQALNSTEPSFTSGRAKKDQVIDLSLIVRRV